MMVFTSSCVKVRPARLLHSGCSGNGFLMHSFVPWLMNSFPGLFRGRVRYYIHPHPPPLGMYMHILLQKALWQKSLCVSVPEGFKQALDSRFAPSAKISLCVNRRWTAQGSPWAGEGDPPHPLFSRRNTPENTRKTGFSRDKTTKKSACARAHRLRSANAGTFCGFQCAHGLAVVDVVEDRAKQSKAAGPQANKKAQGKRAIAFSLCSMANRFRSVLYALSV